ncbi:MAG: AgmX/PglI C-terminal domain-containing protein [Myxococcota bacterium]
MAKCPFCQSPIDGDILMYGGSCPKCFGEIPGEEAATDPGEEVKARQQRSDNRRVLVRTLIPLALAAPVVGMMLLLAVGFIIWNRNPTVEVMNFDELEVGIDYDIVAADPEEENPDPDAGKPTPKPNPGGTSGTNPAPRPQPTTQPNSGGVADPTKPPEVKVDKPKGLGGFDIDINVQRDGEVISDPGQIFEMIRVTMAKNQGSLKACYDSALKTNENLEGRWRAAFTVNEKGIATNIAFTGMNMSDGELEKCLASTVSRWKFAKIARPQPVEKSWRFRPN